MTQTLSESKARPLRTAIQASPALAIIEGLDSFVYDMNERQYAVAVVLLTMLFSFLQTAYEDYKGRAILRKVTPAGVPNVEVPVIT